jgi:hypothetical protein
VNRHRARRRLRPSWRGRRSLAWASWLRVTTCSARGSPRESGRDTDLTADFHEAAVLIDKALTSCVEDGADEIGTSIAPSRHAHRDPRAHYTGASHGPTEA